MWCRTVNSLATELWEQLFFCRHSLTIRTSRGLQIKLETDLTPSPLKEEIHFPLTTALNPFETFEIPLIIRSKHFVQKDLNSVEHELTMSWPLSTEPKNSMNKLERPPFSEKIKNFAGSNQGVIKENVFSTEMIVLINFTLK